MKRLLGGRRSKFSMYWIIVFLLSVLGFAGCRMGGVGVVMYGTPGATYRATVKVRNVANEPLKGIRITLRSENFDDRPIMGEYHITDDNGQVDATYQGFPSDTVYFNIKDSSGTYNKSPVLESERVGKGSGDWYVGEYHKKLEVVLTEKVEE